MNIAEKIVLLRKKKGISQEELANELHTSRQAVSKWENDQSTPDLAKVVALSQYFGVTTDYLLTDNIETAAYHNSRESDPAFQKLKSEVTEEEYEYAVNEAKKKKHFSFWLMAAAPFAVILAVVIYYYCFYR